MRRDADRALVYAVEQAVFEETLFAEPLGARGVVEVARALADEPWWKVNAIPFTVVPTRREAQHSSASQNPGRGGSAQIRLSVFQEDAATLAHEAAHLLAGHHGAETAHGPVFLAAEIDVVTVVCGRLAALRVAKAFDAAGLERSTRTWHPPDRVTDHGLYGGWRIAHLSPH